MLQRLQARQNQARTHDQATDPGLGLILGMFQSLHARKNQGRPYDQATDPGLDLKQKYLSVLRFCMYPQQQPYDF